MKHLINSLLVTFILGLSFNFLYAQTSNNAYSIFKGAETAHKNKNYEQAFNLYSQYVKEIEFTNQQDGDVLGKCYFQIGHYYLCGHFVKCNIDSAILNLDISCLAYKNHKAARLLSQIYYFKKYNHIDLNKSFGYLICAADLGDIKSNLELGQIYLSGSTRCMKDTTIYTYHNRVNNNGDTIRSKGYSMGMTPTSTIIKYPMIERDSIKGYKYYERGIDVNWRLYGADYSLSTLDFARAYMDGTFLPQDYKRAWEYLKELEGV